MISHPKYPRTPCWPSSPSIGAGDRTTPCPKEFLGVDLVITEKLDGSNILLHQGQVYARSTSGGPATAAPWLAMVRKHHAWKLAQPGCEHILLYGEDLYGVHAIEYSPMREDHTFRVFASMRAPGTFDSFRETKGLAQALDIPTVPVLHEGAFGTKDELDAFLQEIHAKPSLLGGPREGAVIRLAGAFDLQDFARRVCKTVRPDHVQQADHWKTRWRHCRTTASR